MKKLLIDLGMKALAQILKKSIRNQNLLAKITVLISVVTGIVDVLTDDDVTNDDEVADRLNAGLKNVLTTANSKEGLSNE